jgi:hypothetical protein
MLRASTYPDPMIASKTSQADTCCSIAWTKSGPGSIASMSINSRAGEILARVARGADQPKVPRPRAVAYENAAHAEPPEPTAVVTIQSSVAN